MKFEYIFMLFWFLQFSLIMKKIMGLSLCPEQTLGAGSSPSPSTSKGSSTNRCSNTPRITKEEATTYVPTPRVTGIQGCRNIHLASGTGFLQFEPAPGADLDSQVLWNAQDYRITGSQRKLSSQEIRLTHEHWSSDIFTITDEAKTSFQHPA